MSFEKGTPKEGLTGQIGQGGNLHLTERGILIKPEGAYTPPKEILIGDIPAVIVDPHNEVFPFWARHLRQRVILLHIDDHPDMDSRAYTMEQLTSTGVAINFDNYGTKYLNIANFISAAIHYGFIGPVYWFNPRRGDSIARFGELADGKIKRMPLTRGDHGIVEWAGYPAPEIIPAIPLADLQNCRHPWVLDIDLDAFVCITDPEYKTSKNKLLYPELNPKDISINDGQLPLSNTQGSSRIDKALGLLREIPLPQIITIARSQTPWTYIPSDRVDQIQDELIRKLSILYNAN